MTLLRLIGMVWTATLSMQPLSWSQTEGESPSTLSVYRLLSERIGKELADALPVMDSTTVSVSIDPEQNAWIVEEGMLGALTSRGLRIKESTHAMLRVGCVVEDVGVSYDNIREDSFFGSRVVDRNVHLRMHIKVVAQTEGDHLLRKDFEEEYVDTIRVADLQRIETPGVPLTKAVLPAEGFFTTLFEPVIVAAAIGIAVLLLFTVRS